MGAATFGPSAMNSAPRTKEERQSFARNPALAEFALGIPGTDFQSPGDRNAGQIKAPKPGATSTRKAPTSLLGGTPDSNARSTGRSLIKDPAGAGSLLS